MPGQGVGSMTETRITGRYSTFSSLAHLFLALLVLTMAGKVTAQAPRPSTSPRGDGVLAQVNDEVILYSDVISRIRPRLKRYARQLSKKEYQKRRQELFQKSVSLMIQEEVLQQEARALGLKVSEQEVDERKQEIIEKVGSEEAFKKGLFQQGMTMDMWERRMRTQILNRKLFQKKFRESRDSFFVSPQEMKTYYRENKLQFYREAKVKGHVLSFPFDSTEDRDQKVRLALSVRDQLKEGASFTSIVESYKSLDPEHSRSFDWTKKGEFLKPVEYILFHGMGDRSIRGPFVAENRIFIVKRTGKIKSKQSPLTDPEVQKEIRKQIKQRKRKERLDQIRERLIEQAYINPRYLIDS